MLAAEKIFTTESSVSDAKREFVTETQSGSRMKDSTAEKIYCREYLTNFIPEKVLQLTPNASLWLKRFHNRAI